MNKVLITRSSVADAIISKRDDLRGHASKMIAGVGIVAMSLLAACQSPIAISPIVAESGSVQTVTSSSSGNEARAPDNVRYEPNVYLQYIEEISPSAVVPAAASASASESVMLAGTRSDTESIMDNASEVVQPVVANVRSVSASDALFLEVNMQELQKAAPSGDSTYPSPVFGDQRYPEMERVEVQSSAAFVSEDVQAMAERDANYKNRSIVESDSTYQYYSILAEIRAEEAASAASSDAWVGDGHLLRWQPEAIQPAPGSENSVPMRDEHQDRPYDGDDAQQREARNGVQVPVASDSE